MNPASESQDRSAFWEETLENLQEAARIIDSTREEILDYDWYSIPESDLSEMCAYSKILLKQVKEASASMIDRLEGRHE